MIEQILPNNNKKKYYRNFPQKKKFFESKHALSQKAEKGMSGFVAQGLLL
jgi:hypothetical protein